MRCVVIAMSLTPRNKEAQVVVGSVIEALPNTTFRVEFPDASSEGSIRKMIVYLGGKMKFNRIRILVGDRVEIQLDDINGEKGRIIRRL